MGVSKIRQDAFVDFKGAQPSPDAYCGSRKALVPFDFVLMCRGVG